MILTERINLTGLHVPHHQDSDKAICSMCLTGAEDVVKMCTVLDPGGDVQKAMCPGAGPLPSYHCPTEGVALKQMWKSLWCWVWCSDIASLLL